MYCTVNDIITALSVSEVARLSNDTNGATVDSDNVETAIAASTTIINGYLRGRYSLPLTNSHPELNKICINLTIPALYERRGQITELTKSLKIEAFRMLEHLQSGKIQLDEGEPESRPKYHYYVKKPDVYNNKLDNFLK